MQRGAKRKAAAAMSPPTADARAAKRQKAPTASSPSDSHFVPDTDETPESTTEAGLRYLEQLKQAKDKNGREIATAFLTLPDKEILPEYYEEIALPIAIDTIQDKLKKKQYRNLSGVESDLKRMVSNAKAFNETNSEIFQDAERIRKNSSNWMVKYNPAYKIDGYVAFATPIPETVTQDSMVTGPGEEEEEEVEPEIDDSVLASKDKRRGSRVDTQETQKESNGAIVPAITDPDEEGFDPNFKGKTFQQAQEQIVNEMIKYQDEDGYPMFEIFIQLPSRKLKEYYEIIKQPQSLKGVNKKVLGVHGRNETTGSTDLKSWDAFENEVKKIWDNAREYNMDGSEVFNLAGDLEEFFKSRLTEAKKVVEEPPQPTLKLKMAPTPAPIKIRLGGNKESPAPTSQQKDPTPTIAGVSVDHSALERQKKDVQASVNGSAPSRSQSAAPQRAESRPLSRDAHLSNREESQVSTTNDVVATPDILNGDSNQTITVNDTRRSSDVSSNQGQGRSNQTQVSSESGNQPSISTQYHPPAYNPANDWDSPIRKEGTDSRDALIRNLYVRTHPELPLNGDFPWEQNIPAHNKLSQQSIVATLPQSHYFLQLDLTLAAKLGTMAVGGGRPYKLFVQSNGQRLSAIANPRPNHLLYDTRLGPGINRIDVECVTTASGKGMGKGGSDLEMERITVFVHLLPWNDEFI